MSLIPKDFETFLSQFKDNWRTIDIRVIAWKIEIGWLFHQIRIVLDSEPVTKPTFKDIPKIDNLLVVHERWDIKKLKQLLASIETTELKIGGETIHIKTWNGQQWKPLSLNYRYHEKDTPLQKYGINFLSCSLEGYSTRQVSHNEKDIINHQLRTYKHPWDGLQDLRMNFIGLSEQWSSLDNSNLIIIAPIYLKIDEIYLEKNDLFVEVEKSDMIKFEDILLSIISHFENNEITRINQPIKQKNIIVKLKKIPIKSKIMINYRKHVPDSKEIYGYTVNQRIQVYQEFSGELQDFLEDITESGKRKNARVFEAKVSLLFHLLGFSPAYYGYGSDDVPDILVFDNDNKSVMVVECTLQQPDINNKLSKLSSRTTIIEQTFPDVQVLPVLITALPRDSINKSDEDKAETESIAIITSNEFDSLITMGLEQISATVIFDYIQTLIPYRVRERMG